MVKEFSSRRDHSTTLIIGAQQTVEHLELLIKLTWFKIDILVLTLLTILFMGVFKIITKGDVNKTYSTIFQNIQIPSWPVSFGETTLYNGFVFIQYRT